MSRTALIIEDDPLSAEILASLLGVVQMSSLSVDHAAQVEAALGQLQGADVIFLDLELPDVDGYEVLAFLKEQLGVACPIVACTMHTNEMNNAYKAGFHSFIGKPVQAAKFPEQLAKILNNIPVWEK
jgi:CheY-like chemotaxis protein